MSMRSRCIALLALAGCGDNDGYRYADLVEVSSTSPYGGAINQNCGGIPSDQQAQFLGAEVEPSLAIDPTDDTHEIAIWQQDRWSSGGANGLGVGVSFDGGETWKMSLPKLSACAGNATYTRASDPWVSFAGDGTPYIISISFGGGHTAVLATASHDRGLTWDDPTPLLDDTDPDVFNDKESITADPSGNHVYAVWDRLTGLSQPDQPIGTGPTWLARATNGVWEPAHPVFDPGVDNQTIGNVVVVEPDGSLVDVFSEIDMTSSKNPTATVGVIRSADHGDTWSAPVTIGTVMAVGVGDSKSGVGVRTGAGLPQIAADPSTGALYVVWEDARFSQMQRDAIALSRSLDGGQTWSPPIQVNGAPDAQAFVPAVAVAIDGTVGVAYYDTRDDDPRDASSFRATEWLALSTDGGQTFTDTRISSGFDLSQAKLGPYYFLGDYQGLMTRGTDFVPLFGVGVGDVDPSDIFVRP
jgi:hypothetical protein